MKKFCWVFPVRNLHHIMMTSLLGQFRNEVLDVWKVIRRSFPAQSIQFDALSSRKPLTYAIKVIQKKKKSTIRCRFL